ncbi:MAG: polyphosphate kinase 2 family protein [Paracoccaceae bacterium]
MKKLQAKLNRLAENLSAPVAVILEGRDTAGKSSTIRELTHYLPPDLYSVCLSHKPSKRAMSSWLAYWETKLPRQNQIVFFDRSWYSRAMVQHLNGWCTPKQYEIFMRDHKNWEANQPVRLIKFWLSISESEQKRRIEYRKNSPLTYWKFSPNDENALSHYDRMSILKERVIDSDWHTIDFENKSKGIKKLLDTLCRDLA